MENLTQQLKSLEASVNVIKGVSDRCSNGGETFSETVKKLDNASLRLTKSADFYNGKVEEIKWQLREAMLLALLYCIGSFLLCWLIGVITKEVFKV